MKKDVLLITPPFTQLNTPYPATAYLKGFLNTRNISSFQADLGIETTLQLFTNQHLTEIFRIAANSASQTDNTRRIISQEAKYTSAIEPVVRFLQGKDPTIAHRISSRRFLPEASRFEATDDLRGSFGDMGLHDKAKHLATLYLEDLSDLIKECVDPHFGFTRYAEKLGLSARSFDDLYDSLKQSPSYIDTVLLNRLEKHVARTTPILVGISAPFPGNLFAAFRCGQWLKTHHPHIKVAMGGGFANTELRSLADVRVFEFLDFITLDDGEAPIEQLYKYAKGEIETAGLKRTFLAGGGTVTYVNNAACGDYKQALTGTPDYTDLPLHDYISAIEVANPMHSLWSDGRWNKLTMAHGCYWGKCTFCDITLDYIKRYEPLAASALCDQVEAVMIQTGNTGFHFVDEAAPPALMREFALEIIRRKLVISWWTNIRFEKSFSRDLCFLLRASGCIAVSGGLEVASDRLLKLIDKGITVGQVALVNKHFCEAGIMVHAYLMYGFPTQTAQETVDALEMVRQMFQNGILQSAYWHLFTMTAHSPVGLNPGSFGVKNVSVAGTFANNDLEHEDTAGDHTAYSHGLKKSLLNFMHGAFLDYPLQKWFDFKVPKTKIAPEYIKNVIDTETYSTRQTNARVVYVGTMPEIEMHTKSKKGGQWAIATLTFLCPGEKIIIKLAREQGVWLYGLLGEISINHAGRVTLQQVEECYTAAMLTDFELFWDNKPVNGLYRAGLLVI